MALAKQLVAVFDADPACVVEVERVLSAVGSPHLPSPDARFVETIAARLTSLDELARLHVDDLFVAHHAALGHPAAIEVIRRSLAELGGTLRRTGASRQQIDELLGELPAELVAPRAGAAPRILGYAGKGPLAAWLRVVAVRALVERRRKTEPLDHDEMVAEVGAPDLDPELALLRRTYAAEFRAAFVAAIAALSPADRLVLRQHHLDGLGIDRLAMLHGVHRSTVARWLVAIRESIFDAVRRHLLTTLRIGGATFDSILRLVRSELDVTVEHYL